MNYEGGVLALIVIAVGVTIGTAGYFLSGDTLAMIAIGLSVAAIVSTLAVR